MFLIASTVRNVRSGMPCDNTVLRMKFVKSYYHIRNGYKINQVTVYIPNIKKGIGTQSPTFNVQRAANVVYNFTGDTVECIHFQTRGNMSIVYMNENKNTL